MNILIKLMSIVALIIAPHISVKHTNDKVNQAPTSIQQPQIIRNPNAPINLNQPN
jgi:hypothetical protein